MEARKRMFDLFDKNEENFKPFFNIIKDKFPEK